MALPPAFVYNSEFKPCALNGRTGGRRSRNVSTEVTTRRKPGGVYQPRPRNLRFTYNRVRILPKSYTFYFSLPLYNAAREAYRLIKTANLIYIHNDADKQNRKELYERAQGYYNSMLDVLDLAYMNVNHEKLPSNVLKEWVKLITDELAQISKIKRSDKAR